MVRGSRVVFSVEEVSFNSIGVSVMFRVGVSVCVCVCVCV